MCSRDYVLARCMYLRMNRERSDVNGMAPFCNFAAMIHQNKIRNADLHKVHPEGIYPEVIQVLRIASSNVPGYTLVES